MNYLKRKLGFVWMLTGPLVIFFLIWQATEKIGVAWKQASILNSEQTKEAARSIVINTSLQWAIIILVFIPIAYGLVIFGKYASSGEYDHLPERSEEL